MNIFMRFLKSLGLAIILLFAYIIIYLPIISIGIILCCIIGLILAPLGWIAFVILGLYIIYKMITDVKE